MSSVAFANRAFFVSGAFSAIPTAVSLLLLVQKNCGSSVTLAHSSHVAVFYHSVLLFQQVNMNNTNLLTTRIMKLS